VALCFWCRPCAKLFCISCYSLTLKLSHSSSILRCVARRDASSLCASQPHRTVRVSLATCGAMIFWMHVLRVPVLSDSTMCVSVSFTSCVWEDPHAHADGAAVATTDSNGGHIFATRQLPGKLTHRLTRCVRMFAGRCKAPSEQNKVLVGVFVHTDDQLRPGARSSEAARHKTRTHAPCRRATPSGEKKGCATFL